MTTHATALARLTGARTQHTLSDATADVFAEILANHRGSRAYVLVLARLGVTS